MGIIVYSLLWEMQDVYINRSSVYTFGATLARTRGSPACNLTAWRGFQVSPEAKLGLCTAPLSIPVGGVLSGFRGTDGKLDYYIVCMIMPLRYRVVRGLEVHFRAP